MRRQPRPHRRTPRRPERPESAAPLGAAALAIALALPAVLQAQERHGGHVHGEDPWAGEEDPHLHRVPRWDLGGGFAVAVPQGEFASFVDEGYGLALHATYALDRSAAVGLRFDAGVVTYGSERFTLPLLPTTGRILVDLRTRNNIGFLGLGPQLQLPSGPVRPFLNGFVGLGYFFTESSVGGTGNFGHDDFARTVNFDDASLAYGGGGGIGLRLGHGRNPVYLNFEAQYRNHGRTEYLREGGIIDDGFGGVIVSPLVSDADFLLVQLGVSVGL